MALRRRSADDAAAAARVTFLHRNRRDERELGLGRWSEARRSRRTALPCLALPRLHAHTHARERGKEENLRSGETSLARSLACSPVARRRRRRRRRRVKLSVHSAYRRRKEGKRTCARHRAVVLFLSSSPSLILPCRAVVRCSARCGWAGELGRDAMQRRYDYLLPSSSFSTSS